MTEFLIEPPKGLFDKIIQRIRREERLLVLKRVILFSFLLVGSVIGFFPSINLLVSDFNQSGFLKFFSLIFSDSSIVAIYWKSFIMTLLETIPTVSIALFLAILLTFLQSIKSLTKNIKIIRKINLAAN